MTGRCLLAALVLASSCDQVPHKSYVESSGYGLFSNGSPSLFFTSATSGGLKILVYDDSILPQTVRKRTREDNDCSYYLYYVTFIGREYSPSPDGTDHIKVKAFLSAEHLSQSRTDDFLQSIGSAALDSQSVCSSEL